MMRYPEFLLSLIIVTAGYTHADSVIDLCPRRNITHSISIASSASIRSPGYPSRFTGSYSCILTIPVPEYTLVTLVVDGPFNLFIACTVVNPGRLVLNLAQQTMQICGKKENNTELFKAYTGDSPFNLSAKFHTTTAWSRAGNFTFNIKYTAFHILSNNSIRGIKYQRELYFVSHGSYNGVDDYPNNIDTAITITDLGVHTSVRLEFSDGLDLADGENCSDYLDIVGVRGYPNNTKRMCGNFSPQTSVHLTSAANHIVLCFKTNSINTGTGFQLKYTVISQGCSDAELLPNATLTPTPDSNSTFTLTCLQGFTTSKSTQTQTVECVEGQWMPSLLLCQEMLVINKATRKVMGSAIGGSVAAVLLIILVVITVICLRRRQQCRTLCPGGIPCNTQQKSGSSESKVVRDDEVRANQALTLPAPATNTSGHSITDGDHDYLSPISTRRPVNTEPTDQCGNYMSLIQRTGNDDKYEALRPESPSSSPLIHVQRGGPYENSDVMYPTYYNLPRKTLNNDAEYEYPMECLTRRV